MNLTKAKPLLSVIIPSFNSLENLKKCIKSIEKQSFKDYEVIIVDADSNDGTKTFLKNLEAPFYWISEKDNGIYDAMNKGILKSTGKWLYFLGTDDLIYSKNTFRNVFNKPISSAYSLTLGNIKYNFKPKDSFLLKKNLGQFNSSWSHLLWFYNSVHHQSIFYRRDVFDKKIYSLNYQTLADYDMNLYLFKYKMGVLRVPEIISLCGTSGKSKIYNWKLYKEEIDLKMKNGHILLKPLFLTFIFFKYLLKKYI